MKNRFMLAPLTNCQSHADGTLSAEERHWLEMRAQGGFALTMTCATSVQGDGVGFAGQLGIYSDEHVPGLSGLATALRAADSLGVVQLHHAGMRAPEALTGKRPVCPSEDAETGARALEPAEIGQLIDDFVRAAERAERAGFDGVELHGAHGYLLCEFLSPTINRRQDEFGGSLENRSRVIREIIRRIRERCSPDFVLGIRLSPERFGLELPEIRELCAELMRESAVDFIDLSLWDVFKLPEDESLRDRPLIDWFTDLERGRVRMGVAGKVSGGADARRCLEAGADFAIIGRAAILHHDFPERVRQDPQFTARSLPVTPAYLLEEGLSEPFINYMRNWKGFVAEEKQD